MSLNCSLSPARPRLPAATVGFSTSAAPCGAASPASLPLPAAGPPSGGTPSPAPRAACSRPESAPCAHAAQPEPSRMPPGALPSAASCHAPPPCALLVCGRDTASLCCLPWPAAALLLVAAEDAQRRRWMPLLGGERVADRREDHPSFPHRGYSRRNSLCNPFVGGSWVRQILFFFFFFSCCEVSSVFFR